MGLLTVGNTLSWQETSQIAEALKESGISQLIKNYRKFSSIESAPFKWGYEIEYCTVKFDRKTHTVSPLCIADDAIPALNSVMASWNPEYASFMIETIPEKPFESNYSGAEVLSSMLERRAAIKELLKTNYSDVDAAALTMGSFPVLGAGEIKAEKKNTPPLCPYSLSRFVPTEMIAGHPRFKTLTNNIVCRRNEKPVDIRIPVFVDAKTDPSLHEIYMDAMAFGMGCCCLQVTTQLSSAEEAAFIYDQLLAFGPIALALTAASPIFRGFLADVDSRWDVISMATDDRTDHEKTFIFKPRYASASLYVSRNSTESLNDLSLPINYHAFERLTTETDMPKTLARHFSYLFIRDPLVAYQGVDYDDPSMHDGSIINSFENIQTSNWNSIRFKIPPPEYNGSIGWRVEFRPMEVQPSDEENTAFSLLIIALIQTLVALRKQSNEQSFDMRIPVSLVDSNYATAQRRNACQMGKFWFRQQLDRPVELLAIRDIICDENNGILALIKRTIPQFWNSNEEFFELIHKRATGEQPTPASRIRSFVANHAAYQSDSIVSSEIAYDLLKHMAQ